MLVSCRSRPEGLLLQVWDSGPGIDDAQLPRIFDEYYQVGPGEGVAGEPVPARRGCVGWDWRSCAGWRC